MKLKVLITGATGFIGTRLARDLVSGGVETLCSGRRERGPSDLPGQYVQLDLDSEESCRNATSGVDVVIHCAGMAGAWGSYAAFAAANIEATRRILAAAKAAGVKRFINISSPSIYFAYKHQFDLKESYRPKVFSNAYAATKCSAEQLVSKAHDANFWTLSFRPRGVLGAGDRNWLPRIIQMREANALVQVGSGENLVDFTAIANLIDAIRLAMEAKQDAYGCVYNITNGRPERLWDVIKKALFAVGLDAKRRRVPYPLAMLLAKGSEVLAKISKRTEEPNLLPIKVGVANYSMTLDIGLARKKLGYVPKATTDQAIEEFALWWQSVGQ